MARRILDVGDFANDGTGDSIRVAAIKLNENLSEIYNYFGNGSVLTFGTLTSSTSGNTVLGGDSFRVVGNTGQVSIGTDNPTVLFQVSSSSGVTSYTDQVSDVFKIEGNTDQGINISTGDSSNGYIAFSNTSTRAAGALGYDQGLNSLTIFTDNTGRMQVDSSGHVLIGTTSSTADLSYNKKLKISGPGPALILEETDTSQMYTISALSGSLVFRDATNSVERMRIAENGRVGIGTNTPDTLLDVEGGNAKFGVTGTGGGRLIVNSMTDNVMRLSVNRTGTTGQLAFHTGADTERMRIDSSGNVGIGVESPIEKLDVYGNLRLSGASTAGRTIEIGTGRTDSGYAFIDLVGDTTYTDYGVRLIRMNTGANADSRIMHRGTGELSFRTQDDSPITFRTTNIERMRINSAGRVGIGTALPLGTLHVYALNTTTPSLTFGASAGQIFQNEASELAIGLSSSSPYPLYMQGRTTANVARDISLQPLGGNIGIGTTDSKPASKLNVAQGVTASNDGSVTPYFQLHNTNAGTDLKRWRVGGLDSGSLTFDSVNDAYSAAATHMLIASTGNVGVGTNSPSYKLDVAGTIHSSTGGFRFPDGSTQTTAGLEVPNGKSIAFALIFG